MKRRIERPQHINPDLLPRNVYYYSDGRWVYKRQVKGDRKTIYIGDSDITLGDIHKAVEEILSVGAIDTFKTISSRFLKSAELKKLKPRTMMYLAYLTGRRRTDIQKLTKNDLLPEGIFFPESKTDKKCIVSWSDHLRQTVDLIVELSPGSKYLFPASTKSHTRLSVNSSQDIHVTDSAMNNAMQKLGRKMTKAGFNRFQFKDIRKKYGTDIETKGGDAQKSLMHSNRSTTDRHYTSKPTIIDPAE